MVETLARLTREWHHLAGRGRGDPIGCPYGDVWAACGDTSDLQASGAV